MCVCVFIKLHITAQSGPVIYLFYATACNPPGAYLCVCVSLCSSVPYPRLYCGIRVFAKSRLRFGLQVRSKTETKPNFGFIRVCEEQSVNFSVFGRNKLSLEIQIILCKPKENGCLV